MLQQTRVASPPHTVKQPAGVLNSIYDAMQRAGARKIFIRKLKNNRFLFFIFLKVFEVFLIIVF